jgi:hypothetical protein
MPFNISILNSPQLRVVYGGLVRDARFYDHVWYYINDIGQLVRFRLQHAVKPLSTEWLTKSATAS